MKADAILQLRTRRHRESSHLLFVCYDWTHDEILGVADTLDYTGERSIFSSKRFATFMNLITIENKVMRRREMK